MSMKKAIAALLALCLMLGGAMGALAESDAANDLLGFFLDATAQDAPAEAGGSDSNVYEAEDPYAGGEMPIVVDQPITADETADASQLANDERLMEAWQNILLLGTDSRTSEKDARTDTMIVLSINTETNEIRLASLMRDIWVNIPGHGGGKLNAACVYGGPELTVQCVNENFGLNIQYYVLVNMQCLAAIVDGLGGIRMDVSGSEASAINKLFADDRNSHDENVYFAGDNVSAGSQVLLNGKQALAFARIRSLDNDYARTDRQRQVLVVIAKQLQQQDLLSLAGIVTGMLQYVETNLTFDEIMAIAGACLNADLDGLTELRLPAEGTYQAGTFSGTWCIKPDFEANAALLRRFILGE
ncbi:MAG: LCP family protein [Clostridia bacterium]|nr:LCP family protein [Clostridia bacterium]